MIKKTYCQPKTQVLRFDTPYVILVGSEKGWTKDGGTTTPVEQQQGDDDIDPDQL